MAFHGASPGMRRTAAWKPLRHHSRLGHGPRRAGRPGCLWCKRDGYCRQAFAGWALGAYTNAMCWLQRLDRTARPFMPGCRFRCARRRKATAVTRENFLIMSLGAAGKERCAARNFENGIFEPHLKRAPQPFQSILAIREYALCIVKAHETPRGEASFHAALQ